VSERFEIAVVGAGPAGSAAARILARGGCEVLLLDAAAHPRVKPCGGGLVGRARRELSFEPPGLSLCAAEMHAHDAGVAVRIERPLPFLWMAMRSDLDARLVAAAALAGAEVRTPCAVRGARVVHGGVELDTERGVLSAGACVVADGVFSRTARALGWPESGQLAPALEWEIAVADERAAPFRDAARFDFDCVPDGYGWVFPKTDHLSVGVLSLGRAAKDLRAHLERYLAGRGLDAHAALDRRGFAIPLAPRPGPPGRGRVLLAGDALGLCDPLTAEGISSALVSGRLAAESLLAQRGAPERAAEAYARSLRRALLADFGVARRLAGLLYGRPRWRNRVLRAFGREMCEALVAQIAGEVGYRELLTSPRSYARLFRARLARAH
jgi:geranylgeranyl reductase family protein